MQSIYLHRNMNEKINYGFVKTKPFKPNFSKAKTNAFSRKGSFTFVFTILPAKHITLKGANFEGQQKI